MTFDDLEFNERPGHPMGVQARTTFPNGYGVSVIKGPHSYGGSLGLYELAVLGPDGHLCYDTPVTDDVLGHLTPEDVTKAINQVEAL